MQKGRLCFIDLFAGAGGLSEGFMQEGFVSVAHVEMDVNACNTLRTRECYHYLRKHGRKDEYYLYLRGEISRDQLYKSVPKKVIQSVICRTMTETGMPDLFAEIDDIMQAKRTEHVDVMLGGPPCQAYSVVGRARKDMADDPRNYLYKLYLQAIGRYGFERLAQRVLRECGFTQVEVTKKSGDGGIDGTGKLKINGIFSFNVAFQCKRYSGLVGAPVIRDFRGSLTTNIEKGVLITTGSFSKAAREEAASLGKQQIDLVDGEDFINMIAEYGIGVREVKTYEIDESFFQKI